VFSTQYSKEENGIVERSNKEVNRNIGNILSDKDCVKNWPQMLCITDNFLNSVKQPLGASPNTFLFVNSIIQDPTIIQVIDQLPDGSLQLTICTYVDQFMTRQARLYRQAVQSQQRTNYKNLRRRYTSNNKIPMLRQRNAINRPTEIMTWISTRRRNQHKLPTLKSRRQTHVLQ